MNHRIKNLATGLKVAFAASISTLILGQPVAVSSSEQDAAVVAPAVKAAEEKVPPIIRHYKGRIVHVGKKRITVRLKRQGRRTFKVSPQATVTRNAKAVRLRRLRPRDQVRLTSEVDASGERLTVIHAWMPL